MFKLINIKRAFLLLLQILFFPLKILFFPLSLIAKNNGKKDIKNPQDEANSGPEVLAVAELVTSEHELTKTSELPLAVPVKPVPSAPELPVAEPITSAHELPVAEPVPPASELPEYIHGKRFAVPQKATHGNEFGPPCCCC